jgi:ATP-dependent metalloprotease FtsH
VSSTALITSNISNKKIVNETISNVKKQKESIENIVIVNDKLALIKKKFDDKVYRVNIPNVEYLEKRIDVEEIPVEFIPSQNWADIIITMTSVLLMMAIFFSITRNMTGFTKLMEVEKSGVVMKNINIKFKDIIGQKNAKESVMEFVDILKNNDKYNSIGVKVPKGALLSGPPGTGKTLLAKAIASESNLPFINMNGSDFNAIFVGVGSAKIKNLFKEAKKAANENGGCVIFIDEIDAIGQKRNVANNFGGNSERENTLNQLLSEMDGFDTTSNVLTFGATNRPELLDEALLRPGRFDRKIVVDLPTFQDRIDLFTYYLSKLKIDEKIIKNLSITSSKLTPGLSGADISNIVNESGIISVRNKKSIVSEKEIKEAIDYVLLGNKRENILSEEEKKIIAYHEAGHAVLSYFLPLVENPIKVSIIPREKGMLGFSQSEFSNEKLQSKKKMSQNINVLMAGRAAEEIFCNDITNGASNDIQKATELSKKYLNTFGFHPSNKFMNMNETTQFKNEYSSFIRYESEKEGQNFLNSKYEETLQLVILYEKEIIFLKEQLLEKETIFEKDINKIKSLKKYNS